MYGADSRCTTARGTAGRSRTRARSATRTQLDSTKTPDAPSVVRRRANRRRRRCRGRPAMRSTSGMRRVVIMGAGGRDFHDFNTVFREDSVRPGRRLHGRADPGHRRPRLPAVARRPALPRRHPDPARGGARRHRAHRGCRHGRPLLLGPPARGRDAQGVARPRRRRRLHAARAAARRCSRPRSRSSRSPPSGPGAARARRAARSARCSSARGSASALVRHPMPYGDLEAMRVQRFTSLDEIDAAHPTLEEREEYEVPVSIGMTVYAGVDYAAVLELAQSGVRRPRLGRRATTTSRSPPGPAHRRHRPAARRRRARRTTRARRTSSGRRRRVNKVDSAEPTAVAAGAREHVESVNPLATVILARSPVTLDPGRRSRGSACSSSRTGRR